MATRASSQQPKKGNLSLSTWTDHEVLLNKIYETHVHDDEKFDVESLFIIVENVLKSATKIVDNVVLGSQALTVAHLDEKIPKESFSPPLCTLKSISCEMQCMAPGEEVAYEATLSILNKLSKYSWAAKAVLTLAAFALDYGEFWLLAQNQSSDQVLAKSVGTLRRVSILLKGPNLEKHREALIELNSVIKTTLAVIECIFELEKLSNCDKKDVPALSTGVDLIRVDVFWAIITVVASSTQLCCLTSDEGKKQELSLFSKKLNVIVSELRRQITICKQQIEETEAYKRIVELFRTPTEVIDCLKELIFTKDNVKQLFDGSTGNLVSIDEVLKGKNVLLFISGLDISDDDISILKPIHELIISKEDQYKIVWIPIVEQWTEDLQKKFEMLRAKMPWYVVQYFSPIAGIRFIKEMWHFKGKPSVVVLSPQGKVESDNAILMIRVWGIKAFPFTTAKEEDLNSNRSDWLGFIATGINPNIESWITEEKYIFFYGGKDNKWIQQFTERATALANDPVIEVARISIEVLLVGKGSKGEDNHSLNPGRFWTAIESLFISKTQRKTEADAGTVLEIQKLLSCKNESTGWAVVSKGSSLVLSGRGTTILKAIEEFEKWKEHVHERKDFELSFRDYHNQLVDLHTSSIGCRIIDIPNGSGKIPENMKCPDCPRDMEAYIRFKCCHDDANSLHD
ncbi:protein SIEVE ELEMENT OCCLUSION B-like [Juglans microcarpa x Juglans regia]|uniref:protein SIEVE ELEMENT OCCLUSION B-like n=1 Tax=Juglans microcarpa x Juglans regia TaxID=2249226 RepID=UPI001B7E4BD8|nr:protein SIEVE ELEMENT OCCLUSION B-like [Juglans microcarpa x Juglans regia]